MTGFRWFQGLSLTANVMRCEITRQDITRWGITRWGVMRRDVTRRYEYEALWVRDVTRWDVIHIGYIGCQGKYIAEWIHIGLHWMEVMVSFLKDSMLEHLVKNLVLYEWSYLITVKNGCGHNHTYKKTLNGFNVCTVYCVNYTMADVVFRSPKRSNIEICIHP